MGNIVDKCEGCYKIVDGNCSVYLEPKAKQHLGCAFNYKNNVTLGNKVRVGQQKGGSRGKLKLGRGMVKTSFNDSDREFLL